MRLIIDTNIWYQLPENPTLIKETEKENAHSTFLNYFELLKTRNVVSNPEKVRKIINVMDKYQKIFTPPFVHMAKLHSFYHFNDLTQLKDYITFLVAFKNGDYINPEQKKGFFDYIDAVNNDFSNYAMYLNDEASKIKNNIKNNKKHLSLDSTKFTNSYILNLINQATNRNLVEFDFQKIELFSKTLNQFFKKLEVGDFLATTNDIIDFLILSYVQPGDLYFTKEKKWINLIKEADCEKYLYKN